MVSGREWWTAVAGAIAGDFSPGGRLPITFYKSVDQLPPFEDYSMANRTYRYFHGEPLYPFGYGLSYTKFEYANAHVEPASIPPDGTAIITAKVSNRGPMAGDEVVQLYLTHPGVSVAPIRALEGFQRIHLERGETKTVMFRLHDRNLGVVDENGKHRIVAGPVQVRVGGGQPEAKNGFQTPAGVSTQFTITSEATLPD